MMTTASSVADDHEQHDGHQPTMPEITAASSVVAERRETDSWTRPRRDWERAWLDPGERASLASVKFPVSAPTGEERPLDHWRRLDDVVEQIANCRDGQALEPWLHCDATGSRPPHRRCGGPRSRSRRRPDRGTARRSPAQRLARAPGGSDDADLSGVAAHRQYLLLRRRWVRSDRRTGGWWPAWLGLGHRSVGRPGGNPAGVAAVVVVVDGVVEGVVGDVVVGRLRRPWSTCRGGRGLDERAQRDDPAMSTASTGPVDP